MNDDEDGGYPRMVSRGRTFVYLLPCRDEDILKAGFSRDPLQRLHALHRRYFDFFDLDRALLIEAERLRDARRIERLFLTRFATARAPAPLVIRDVAAGRTEWFRGVAAEADALARELAEKEGLRLHSPLRGWLLERFGEHADRLYEWSGRLLDSIEYEHFNPAVGLRTEDSVQLLRHVLDACTALGMRLQSVVPPRVLLWYESGDLHRPG